MTLSRQSRLAAAARRTISAGMSGAGTTRQAGIARRRLMALLAALPFGTPSLAASPLETGMLPWHHLPDGTFRNPQGSPERGGTPTEWRSFMWRRLVERAPPVAVPDGHVLPARAALAGLEAAAGADSVTWLGHASFLIRLGGRTILTDPFLSERASPFSFFGPKRLARPSLGAADLPPVDILLLSHNHYDHLDLPALQALRASECATAVMPLRVSRYLQAGRFAAMVELDWLQQAEVQGVRITALPAIHFSKRGLFDRNASLWCGFLLEAGGRTVLFTGDTAYGPFFAELAEHLPRPDLALVPIGAYEPRQFGLGVTDGVDIALAHEDRVVGADQHRTERMMAMRGRLAGHGIGRKQVGDHPVAGHAA